MKNVPIGFAGSLALSFWFLLVGVAHAADSAQVARGQERFEYWCAPCHGTDKGENGRPLPGTASLQAKYQGQLPAALEERNDLPFAYIRAVIRYGSEGMPTFRKTEISEDEIRDIAAYLARNAAAQW